ncbi:hypothetical protein [Streptomyces sp. NPDC020983]|uniref:hypothetical protein n=1 Tax=Streptomyces sp. NPDC020983 TaxID=3365106 RepID=UPI0037B4E865
MTTPPDNSADNVVELRDATMTQQWDITTRTYRCYENGTLLEERPFTDAENADVTAAITQQTRDTNEATLLTQARNAYATNTTYLAAVNAGTATTATHIAQVPALTRQMQGIIRLIVGSDFLDGTN